MDEVVKEFLTESKEGLDQLDADLVILEQNPADRDTLARVFRTIHTIKGTCSFLGFAQLETVAHAGESLLALLRDGELKLTQAIADGLLAMVDAVRTLLERIEYTGLDSGDYAELVQSLTLLQKGGKESIVPAVEIVASSENSEPSPEVSLKANAIKPASELPIVNTRSVPASTVSVISDEMAEVVKEFLEESNEGLDRLDNELIDLEQDPANKNILGSIFRTIHTIKGTCGFLGFSRLEKVAHAGENLLMLLRDGELSLNEEITSALLAMVDAVRALLSEIQRYGHDGEESYEDLIATLTRLKESGTAQPALKAPASATDLSAEVRQLQTPASMSEILINQHGVNPEHVAEALSQQDQGDPRALGEILVEKGVIEPKAVVDALSQQRETKVSAAGSADNSIRVSVTLLDKLMNLVGELVLARNQIIDYANFHDNPQLLAIAQRLNLLTSDLQESVMQTRMQPIHNIWAKLPRVVRDLAVSCGKKIRVEMEGKETELDKSLIEAMKDPLTHLVRNSVDHGIELPAKRREAGKPEEGCLLLRAYHEGGQVHIEISDDGAGIKADKLRIKALEKGLITAEQAARMSERELCELIFMPGLSTAEKVTNISGRGVGMDVVKTNIEKISGTIELDSEAERGTTFKIKLPLTLAIVPALIVTSGAERFAIPQVNILELIRLNEEQQNIAIEHIHGSPVYRLRGKLLPVVYLNQELSLASASSSATMVVLQAEQRRFGLIVDQINDTQEIVIKPLAEVLKSISIYAGPPSWAMAVWRLSSTPQA